jgi:hypothetical protein
MGWGRVVSRNRENFGPIFLLVELGSHEVARHLFKKGTCYFRAKYMIRIGATECVGTVTWTYMDRIGAHREMPFLALGVQ